MKMFKFLGGPILACLLSILPVLVDLLGASSLNEIPLAEESHHLRSRYTRLQLVENKLSTWMRQDILVALVLE